MRKFNGDKSEAAGIRCQGATIFQFLLLSLESMSANAIRESSGIDAILLYKSENDWQIQIMKIEGKNKNRHTLHRPDKQIPTMASLHCTLPV